MALLKYEKIAESLRSRITAGEFAPGAILPSERELAARWSVSRATVIKAMNVLRGDGVVEARQGIGHIVTEAPVRRSVRIRRKNSGRHDEGMPDLPVGVPDWAEPPASVAAALRLSTGVLALRRVRVLQLANGRPHSYVRGWFPPDVAESSPGLAQSAPIPEGTARYVRRRTGRVPVEGVDVITVRVATTEEARHLALSREASVAVVLHTEIDQEGYPLGCEEIITPGHLFQRVETNAI